MTEEHPLVRNKPKILLVDDRSEGLLALDAVLKSSDYNLLKASSGEEALVVAAKNDLAVILLDVQMPGMDGFETAERLKQMPQCKDVPIIFITAIDYDDKYLNRGYQAGAVDYVFKPFEPFILRSKVAVFVELHKKTLELAENASRIQEMERDERHRQLAKQELESLQKYRHLTEAIPIVIWQADAKGEIIYFNPAWFEFTGKSKDSVNTQMFLDSVNDEDVPDVESVWKENLLAIQPFEIEARIKGKDKEHWHVIRCVPELGPNNAVLGWVGSCTDIDDRKKAHEDRKHLLLLEQRSREEAENANRTKDEFLATLSHELRTPLNVVVGWSELLLSSDFEKKLFDEGLKGIHRNAHAQAALVNDLLDVSRIITGKLRCDMVLMNVRSLLEESLRSLQLAAISKGIIVTSEIENLRPISGDYGRVKQIISNILSNALKFTPKNGKITVKAKTDNGFVQIEVQDTGQGIEPEFLSQVFERFRQQDSRTTRAHGGLGLGLAIVRFLVENHGGEVEAFSEGRDKGSKFVIRFPAADAEMSEKNLLIDTNLYNYPKKSISQNLKGLEILAVDDVPDSVQLLSLHLGLAGAIVRTATSAKEALGKFLEKAPDLLISDIAMPNEDGFSLIRKVRGSGSEGKNVRAIALTAFARQEERKVILEAGFDEHFPKPIEAEKLISLIQQLCPQVPACTKVISVRDAVN